jgi:hypothetical protein
MDAASHSSRLRLALGAMVTAALLVPLAVYGAPAIARSASSASHQYKASCGQYGSSSSEYQYGSSCKQYRVQVCHRTHSKKHRWHLITVSSRAVKAHLRHGDTLSPCSTEPAAKKKHGKGHGHDDGDRGKSGTEHGTR